MIYRGSVLGKKYDRNAFVCDPANNLIHRDVLVPSGPTFIAQRHDANCEFLASTDTWFRPVFLCQGPGDGICVCDFYREVIETPLSLPEDIQRRYNLQSRGRGRIWRIVPKEYSGTNSQLLSKATDLELVSTLGRESGWARLTAQRLLIERSAKDEEVVKALSQVATPEALWVLDSLAVLDKRLLVRHLSRGTKADALCGTLPLAEQYMGSDADVASAVLALADHAAPAVRFRVAIALGNLGRAGLQRQAALRAICKLARRDGSNPWHETAILSSSLPFAADMLQELIAYDDVPATFVAKLATIVAVTGDNAAIDRVLLAVVGEDGQPTLRRMVLLDGLGHGLSRSAQTLATRLSGNKKLADQLLPFFEKTQQLIGETSVPISDQIAATKLLAYGSLHSSRAVLAKLLAPETRSDLQMAAVHVLAAIPDREAADLLLGSWSSYSPSIRSEVQEALFARNDRLLQLLAAIENGKVQLVEIEEARREQLLKHRNVEIRTRTQKLLGERVMSDRAAVVAEHQGALSLVGEAVRGRTVFKDQCTTCHRLQGEGTEVGPDLLSVLKTKSRETLLVDILDPSREVDPRYLNYIVATKDGRTFTGIMMLEAASSITLRRAGRSDDVVLRADIDVVRSTGKSLMPEGLEKQLNNQQLADLMAYLLENVGRSR
jgi:putative heme-binding domain-containing protein